MVHEERCDVEEPAVINNEAPAAINDEAPAAINDEAPAAIEIGYQAPPRGPVEPWIAWAVAAAVHAGVLLLGSQAQGAVAFEDDIEQVKTIARYLAAADAREMNEAVVVPSSFNWPVSRLDDSSAGSGFGGDDTREERGTEDRVRGGDASAAGSGRGGNGQGPGTAPKPPAKVPVGRLPPEVIQRVVRQDFGRFRLCLERSPSVSWIPWGRISVHFVIGVKGSVTSSTVLQSDFWDRKVAECVAATFKGLHFPAPEGGVVKVTYPIMFSPGG